MMIPPPRPTSASTARQNLLQKPTTTTSEVRGKRRVGPPPSSAPVAALEFLWRAKSHASAALATALADASPKLMLDYEQAEQQAPGHESHDDAYVCVEKVADVFQHIVDEARRLLVRACLSGLSSPKRGRGWYSAPGRSRRACRGTRPTRWSSG